MRATCYCEITVVSSVGGEPGHWLRVSGVAALGRYSSMLIP